MRVDVEVVAAVVKDAMMVGVAENEYVVVGVVVLGGDWELSFWWWRRRW